MEMLIEGMRAGDLEDLVLPMFSVDEFVSKVSDDAMVFAFFVNDRDAANDLNRFIQKSPIKLLDTEVSPAPDQRGFYLVFCEIMCSARLPKLIASLLEEIEPLVVVEKWKMQIRGKESLIAFSEEALTRYMKELNQEAQKKKEKKKSVSEAVLDFLRPSGLSGAKAVDNCLVIESAGQRSTFEVVAFGAASVLTSSLADSPLDISLTDAAKEVRISRMLGEGWSVARVNGLSVLQHEDSDDVLLLRDR